MGWLLDLPARPPPSRMHYSPGEAGVAGAMPAAGVIVMCTVKITNNKQQPATRA